MAHQPPVDTRGHVDESEQTYCYLHPKVPTKLRCSRCDRPICGQCAIPAAVGQQCPYCYSEGRKSQRKIRSVATATSPAVVAILVINALVWILQRVSFQVTIDYAAIPAAIAAGEWYRLVTAMFLHVNNPLHILFNSYVFWIYGPELERTLGTIRFVATYLISGFIGSAVSYAFSDCAQPGGVGASGAIFGVVGALLVYLYRRRTNAAADAYFRGLLGFVGLNIVLGLVLPNIDMWAHIGGLGGGIVMGVVLDQHRGPRTDVSWQAIYSLAVVAAGVALVVWKTSTLSCGV